MSEVTTAAAAAMQPPLLCRAGWLSGPVGRCRVLAILCLLTLVGVVYWPVIGYDFVNWDDPWYVLRNPLIRSWSPSNLWRIFAEPSVKNYAPLTTLSLLVDHTLFGLNAGGYHATNVLWHALNSVLVYVLVSRLSNWRMVGLLTAALFAVHPVQIETVAWVSSRKSLMCTAFMLLAGHAWLREQRTTRHESWGLLWLLLALLSKAAAIVVPPIVLAFDLLVRRRPLAESLARQVVPAFLCLVFLNVTMSAQTTVMGGTRAHLSLSKLHILAIDSVIVWQYVGMLLWPADLCVLYDPPTRGIVAEVVMAVCGWLMVAGTCWWCARRAPDGDGQPWRSVWPAFCVVSWFLLLFPVLNLFPITTLMNDRYLYLPCVCLFAPAAWGVLTIVHWVTAAVTGVQAVRPGQRLLRPACVAVVAGLLVAASAWESMQHLPTWQNDYALWNHAVREVPQLPVVQIQWAQSLHRQGRVTQAKAMLLMTLARGTADEADRQRIVQFLAAWEEETSRL